jgi:hypothetical protein
MTVLILDDVTDIGDQSVHVCQEPSAVGCESLDGINR